MDRGDLRSLAGRTRRKEDAPPDRREGHPECRVLIGTLAFSGNSRNFHRGRAQLGTSFRHPAGRLEIRGASFLSS